MSNIEQKKVSPKVAKYLKAIGYPQKDFAGSKVFEKVDGALIWVKQPTYLDVWLWLMREKNKSIDIIRDCDAGTFIAFYDEDNTDCCVSSDPEDAIVKAIEHLVDNDLIK